MGSSPRYLRVVATTRCNYRCGFCHMEGDPHVAGASPELDAERLVASLTAAVSAGVRKIKFLGGEPLLRRDLPTVIAALRRVAPEVDVSVITAGVVPVDALVAAYAAGLTRVNVSIHGWRPEALARNIRVPDAWARRAAFLDAAIAESERRGVPIKLNYVWSGEAQREDLAAFLDWAAAKPVVVNVLDDLARDLSWEHLAGVLHALRGPHAWERTVDDPDSLATLHRGWSDGLHVELKHLRLGDVAPYAACGDCAERSSCREGIVALRLTHRGGIQPCMERPDLAFELADYAQTNGPMLAASMLRHYAEAL